MHSHGLLSGLLFLLAANLAAQAPTPPPAPIVAITTSQFTTPDGSRFVLVRDPAMTHVEWAIATPTADDPAGLAGLCETVVESSLLGTWHTGSVDSTREMAALSAFDAAWYESFSSPQNAELTARLAAARSAAQALANPADFLRVLATLPADRAEVSADSATCVMQITTLADALGEVGAWLVERREQQALRDLDRLWQNKVAARQTMYDLDPAATLHAELLALAMPNQSASRAAERAARSMPRRSQAMQIWQQTQRPERTVHVLLGNLDLAAAKRTLTKVFAGTALPPAAAEREGAPRPIQSLRRSTVPGVNVPMLAVAWLLPQIDDPITLDLAARWFGGGADSWLGRELARAGRKGIVVQCRAPWPVAIGGHSLLLVEVQDPAGGEGLADLILAACRSGVKQDPPANEVSRVLTAMQCEWTTVTSDPRWHVRELARNALLWPDRPPRIGVPNSVAGTELRKLLTQTFAGQPVIVEGRR